MNLQENDLWTEIHKEWNLFPPNTDNLYQITTFDYGIYNNYTNKWYIYGNWKGKVALCNKDDKNITIGSISLWKISLLNPDKIYPS